MQNTSKVHVVITGGTIDSFYNITEDTVTPYKESVLPQFIESLRLADILEYTTICMKDSRNLNEDDRQKILQTIEQSEAKKIIVTHGTYTMPDSARFLQANLQRKDQIILFTGSMIPLQGFSPSDAPFNLGYCFSELGHIEPGVYVCMNGQTFRPDEVIKELNQGRFSSIFNNQPAS